MRQGVPASTPGGVHNPPRADVDFFATTENHSLSSVVINARPTRSTQDGRPEPSMASCEALCIPAASSPAGSQEGEATVCMGALGGPELATETMGGGDPQDAGGATSGVFQSDGTCYPQCNFWLGLTEFAY